MQPMFGDAFDPQGSGSLLLPDTERQSAPSLLKRRAVFPKLQVRARHAQGEAAADGCARVSLHQTRGEIRDSLQTCPLQRIFLRLLPVRFPLAVRPILQKLTAGVYQVVIDFVIS